MDVGVELTIVGAAPISTFVAIFHGRTFAVIVARTCNQVTRKARGLFDEEAHSAFRTFVNPFGARFADVCVSAWQDYWRSIMGIECFDTNDTVE